MVVLDIGYLVVLGAAMVYAEVVRYQAFGRRVNSEPGRPTPVLVGYLCGGPRRGFEAAVAVLLAQRAIEAAVDGRVVLTSDDDLRRSAGRGVVGAVAAAADGSRRLPELFDDPGVRAALTRTRTDLEERGWARTEAERRKARLGTVPLVGLLAAGLVCALITQDRWLAIGAFVGSLSLVRFLDVKVASAAGEEMLGHVQEDHSHLRPEYGANRALYNPRNLPMTVALFGPALMWIVYPDFAQRTDIRVTLAVVGDDQAGADIHASDR